MPHAVSPNSQATHEPTTEDMSEGATQNEHDEQPPDADVPMADDADESNGINGDDKKDVKLEDLFADVDSDEEFPSSKPDQANPSTSPVPPSSPLYI